MIFCHSSLGYRRCLGKSFAMVVDSVFDVGEFVHKSSDTMELNYGLSLAQKKSEFELCHRKDTINRTP